MAGVGSAVSGQDGESLNQGRPAEDGDVGELRWSDARRENAGSDAMANEQLERHLVRLQGCRGDATHEDLCLFTGRSSPSMGGEETTAQTREH